MVLQPNLVSGCTFIPPFNVPNFKALDNAFVFYNNFHTLTKKKKKTMKLSQFSKVHISETLGVI